MNDNNEIFKFESEMQSWLSQKLSQIDGINDLICNSEYIDRFVPSSREEKKVWDNFKYCIEGLDCNELLIANKNISLKKGDVLKPDFILYSIESQSIVIVELKNFPDATREAGTEISAYAGEIKTYFPFLSEGDLINIVISPSWPTLIRHHLFFEIFYQKRNILCLTPCKRGKEILFKVISPTILTAENSLYKISSKHLGGYNLSLYDPGLYHEQPINMDERIEQMKTALNVVASKGNIHSGHGFAFLWKDHSEKSLAPYSIVIMNVAPFQSIDWLTDVENDERNEITKKFIHILDEYDPIGHGESLNDITAKCTQFLDNFCEPRKEGFLTWDRILYQLKGRAEFIAFKSWGIFDELYMDELFIEYKKGNFTLKDNDPDLGMKVINSIIDYDYPFGYTGLS